MRLGTSELKLGRNFYCKPSQTLWCTSVHCESSWEKKIWSTLQIPLIWKSFFNKNFKGEQWRSHSVKLPGIYVGSFVSFFFLFLFFQWGGVPLVGDCSIRNGTNHPREVTVKWHETDQNYNAWWILLISQSLTKKRKTHQLPKYLMIVTVTMHEDIC